MTIEAASSVPEPKSDEASPVNVMVSTFLPFDPKGLRRSSRRRDRDGAAGYRVGSCLSLILGSQDECERVRTGRVQHERQNGSPVHDGVFRRIGGCCLGKEHRCRGPCARNIVRLDARLFRLGVRPGVITAAGNQRSALARKWSDV